MINSKKRGQVTIFIIIAIVILAAVGLYFVFRGSFSQQTQIPESLEPVYNNFLECVEQDISTGASVLESQGGYIELPEFEPGSEHMPFSSQLNFLDNPLPYWYYVSGNGLEREAVPSKEEMETQLGEFIEQRIRNCEFQTYRQQGFSVDIERAEADVTINDESIEAEIDMGIGISKGNESAFVNNHEIEVNSRLGSLYESALEVYETQQEELFLEEYGIDVLGSYAPVDGFEIQCSPLTWRAEEVINELRESIEVNTMALNTNPEEYYNLDLPVEHRVRFLNSQQWSSTYEVAPNDGDFLVSNPIGNQQGLGALGFCYVPYHFTYNMRYPTLIQVYDEENEEEIFQFPMAVLIEGNQPREPTNAEAFRGPELQLCEYKNTPASVEVFGSDLEEVDAQISYECFGQRCSIGNTEGGTLNEEFPQCVNGYVVANAEGYEEERYLFTTVNGGSLEIILDKIYDVRVDLNVEGNPSFSGEAIISFTSEDLAKTMVYPEENFAELSEGNYEIEVRIYEEGDINLGTTTAEQCIDVPQGGILGAFGFNQERCFDIEVPEQTISQVLIGGGDTEVYLTENDLSSGMDLELNVNMFDTPQTIEDIQVNEILWDNSEVEVSFS